MTKINQSGRSIFPARYLSIGPDTAQFIPHYHSRKERATTYTFPFLLLAKEIKYDYTPGRLLNSITR